MAETPPSIPCLWEEGNILLNYQHGSLSISLNTPDIILLLISLCISLLHDSVLRKRKKEEKEEEGRKRKEKEGGKGRGQKEEEAFPTLRPCLAGGWAGTGRWAGRQRQLGKRWVALSSIPQ